MSPHDRPTTPDTLKAVDQKCDRILEVLAEVKSRTFRAEVLATGSAAFCAGFVFWLLVKVLVQ